VIRAKQEQDRAKSRTADVPGAQLGKSMCSWYNAVGFESMSEVPVTAKKKLLGQVEPGTERSMTGRKAGNYCWSMVSLVLSSILVMGSQAACTSQSTQPEEETAVAQLLTIQPEMVLTLTAWPTPPPIVTRPPTPTAAPLPLWTAAELSGSAPKSTASPGPTATSTTVATPPPVGSSPPAVRLLIPKIGLDVPVVDVSWEVELEQGVWHSVWQTADGAAGHHRNTANPGEAGNVVISGHHNTRGEVFRQVSEIGQPGSALGESDEIILVAEDGQQHTYTIVQWERFQEEGIPEQERQDHARYLASTIDPTLTLVTCWPYESNSHRVVVIAKLQPRVGSTPGP
jgi:LPXTG-site transpeptidase (sortase) family protein